MIRHCQRVGTLRAELGESPVWDVEQQRLHWIDILDNKLLSTDPATGRTDALDLGRRPGSIALTDGEELLIASGQEIVARKPNGEVSILAMLPATISACFNDGKPDAAGRFWVGTAGSAAAAKGHLYRFMPDAGPEPVLDGIRMSNGIGWSPDNRTFYHVDTGTRRLDAFDFDLATGHPSNRRCLLELPPGHLPDGLTVDVEGRIWLAVWGGSCVLVVAPDGSIEGTVELPTSRVSSCTFGGPNMTRLFVTTAQQGMSAEQRAADPLAGALFAFETDVAGLPGHRVALRRG